MNPAEKDRLASRAMDALRHSISPSTGFRVGAALMTANGGICTGTNIEKPSIMLTTCAERVALLKALSEGERTFTAMDAMLPFAFRK